MQINTEQKVLVTIRPLTAAGNPARIDGPVSFAASNPEVVRFEQVDDTSAYVYGAAIGETEITATFDADLDAGEERNLTYTGTIQVVEAEAESATASFGVPVLVLTPPGESEQPEEPGDDEGDDE